MHLVPDVKLLNVKSMLFDNCTCTEALQALQLLQALQTLQSLQTLQAADVIRRSIASKVSKVSKAYIGSIDFIVPLSLLSLCINKYIYRARTRYIYVYRLIIRQNIRQNRIGDGRQSRRGNGRRYGRGNGRRYGRVMEEGTEWATEAVMAERMERGMEGGMRDKKEDRRQSREGADFCAIARSIDLTFNILTSAKLCQYQYINKLCDLCHHLVNRYCFRKFLFAPKSGLHKPQFPPFFSPFQSMNIPPINPQF